MNGNPTSAEKRWHTDICNYCLESGWLTRMYSGVVQNPEMYQLDHLLGAKAKRKVNGVTTKAGEWAVLPIPVELHDITSNHALNRTLKPGAYREAFGHELDVWANLIVEMGQTGHELPFDLDVFNAIMKR